LMDALRNKHGDEAVENANLLAKMIDSSDFEPFKLTGGALSERVRVLCLQSDEPLDNVPVRIQDLATNVEVVHIEGLHMRALQRITREQPAREMAKKFETFLAAL
jgi:hypothetical protein